MKIDSFDKTTVNLVITEASKELQKVAEKYGIQIKRSGSVTFTSTNWNLKFEISTISSDGVPTTKVIKDLEKTPYNYGECFQHNGNRYRIIGYRTRAPKYPYIGQRTSDGKEFCFSATSVEVGLERRN